MSRSVIGTSMSVMFTADDERYMQRALQLALRGRGRVEPNPLVGCVVVRRGRVLGEGYHRRFGGPHAEVSALRKAGNEARGATVYVSLEPCDHVGQTPPCTAALIAAGVKRVVVAMRDPFAKVNGAGIRRLRRAGLRVQTGLGMDRAARLNAPYLTRLRLDRPYVILKWAQSIDGRIASRTGEGRWISGAVARRQVHRLRARVDAILVGIGTVLRDDPRLTARGGGVPVRRVAARVVLDSRLRIPLCSVLVRTAPEAPCVVMTTVGATRRRHRHVEALRGRGVEVRRCRTHDGMVSLPSVLRHLARTGCTNLLVEGGSGVLTRFLDARLVDEAYVYVALRLMGGARAPTAFAGVGVARPEAALAFEHVRVRRVGEDVLYHLHTLRHPAGR